MSVITWGSATVYGGEYQLMPDGLEIRIWDVGARREVLISNPVPKGPVLAGTVTIDGTPYVVDLPSGTSQAWFEGDDPTYNLSPMWQAIADAYQVPDTFPLDPVSPIWPNTHQEPDVAGSPDIAHSLPLTLTVPGHADGWEATRTWLLGECQRPFQYNAYVGECGEHGYDSTSTWQVPDNGHLTTSRLLAGWVVFGSPLARFILAKYGAMLLSRVKGWKGELRGMGYLIESLALLGTALGDPAYVDALNTLGKQWVPLKGFNVPYPMLTAIKWGADSHGFLSKKEVEFGFAFFGWAHLFDPAWNDIVDDGERLAKVKAAAPNPFALFNVARPIVMWMAMILARGCAVANRLHDLSAYAAICKWSLASIFEGGQRAGYDSHDVPVDATEGVHDAVFGPWPLHIEPVKIAHGGTSLWYCSLLFCLPVVSAGIQTQVRDLVTWIMTGATPDDHQWEEICWPYLLL